MILIIQNYYILNGLQKQCQAWIEYSTEFYDRFDSYFSRPSILVYYEEWSRFIASDGGFLV